MRLVVLELRCPYNQYTIFSVFRNPCSSGSSHNDRKKTGITTSLTSSSPHSKNHSPRWSTFIILSCPRKTILNNIHCKLFCLPFKTAGQLNCLNYLANQIERTNSQRVTCCTRIRKKPLKLMIKFCLHKEQFC